MANTPDRTESEYDITVPLAKVIPYSSLTIQQQMWVDYKAVNGLIINDDGMRKMTVNEFAEKLNVAKVTLYDWIKKIPNFWVLVSERRTELASQNRMAKMHEVWELKAMKGDWNFFNAWMLNFNPKYKTPTTKVEHKLNNSWAALAQVKQNIIEGETVDDAKPNQPD